MLKRPHTDAGATLGRAGLVVVLGIATTAWGQDDPPPDQQTERPADQASAPVGEKSPEVETAKRVLPRVAEESAPLKPVKSLQTDTPQPGLTGGIDWLHELTPSGLSVPEPVLLPEGTFLRQRMGRIVRVDGGLAVFIPDPDERTPGEGAMLLLPNRTLSRLLAAMGDRDEITMVLSGEVLVYHARNYLLASTFVRVHGNPADAEPDADPEDGPQDGVAAGPQASLVDDPEVADLLKELDSDAAPAGRGLGLEAAGMNDTQPRRGTGAAPVEAVGPSVPDAEPLVRRRGRLVRQPGGAWAIAFDASARGAPEIDEPLTLVPCRLLMQIEGWAMRDAEAADVLVSGRMYVFGNRTYLLPMLVQRQQRGAVDPFR